jgi:ADP-ribosyl-[dinitrogen reductase] hydrolase
MHDNQDILEKLLENQSIKIQRGPIFDTGPDSMPSDFDFDRFEGMMLGLAVGDSLGNTTEGMLPKQRYRNFGEIRDYLPNRYADGKCVGAPSDDTQLAFWTLEHLLENDGLDPEQLALRFCKDRIFGIGSTVRRFLANFKSGRSWAESGPESAGNGALMRIAPIIWPHLRSEGKGLWADTAICSMITHNDTASISASIAFVSMLWELLKFEGLPTPQWWLDSYCSVARELETGTVYRPRSSAVQGFAGSLFEFVEQEVRSAYDRDLSVLEACNRWYSGAYLLETVPAVLLILMKYGDDPEEAIVRAVNDTKDNDTIGAIVGAAVGALHGKRKLPQRWINGCLGRISYDDDGHIFKLLDEAGKAWRLRTTQK